MNPFIRNRANEHAITIDTGPVCLEGSLYIPTHAHGIVLFAHGSGSSRFSPRNRLVADALAAIGMATLLMDLLTAEEEAVDRHTAHLRFDIALLATRLVDATDWVHRHTPTRELQIGYFGASTGAAAALVAAAQRPALISAIVARGGRPDLAGPVLSQIAVPTLLIVGGNDEPVIAMNKTALVQLAGPKQLVIVPGATHLFEEPEALEEVARLACRWFEHYLTPLPEPIAESC
jgi:dienelactone hydrolase